MVGVVINIEVVGKVVEIVEVIGGGIVVEVLF